MIPLIEIVLFFLSILPALVRTINFDRYQQQKKKIQILAQLFFLSGFLLFVITGEKIYIQLIGTFLSLLTMELLTQLYEKVAKEKLFEVDENSWDLKENPPRVGGMEALIVTLGFLLPGLLFIWIVR